MGDALRVLFVCTGNIYRSPMAEAFFRAGIEKRGLEFTTSSAGTLEWDRPIAQSALAEVGNADPHIAGHRSRLLHSGDILAAHLIIGMARAHVRAVVVLEPDAWNRTFTLKELVRRGERTGPRPPGQPLADWLLAAGAGRTHSDLLGDSVLDDIEDPAGRSGSVVPVVAREIKTAVAAITELVSPPR